MAKTEIQLHPSDKVFNEVDDLARQIRERAYAMFLEREGRAGDPVSDWLSAEEELIWKPAVEVRRKDSQMEILAALPGVQAKDIDVRVAPEDVLIRADVHHEHTRQKGDVQMCEFKHGRAFRSVHLPSPIDPESIKADYHDGMLHLTAALDSGAASKGDIKTA